MRDVERILVPVDFSACSLEALDVALLLAAARGATVDLLWVTRYEPPSTADVLSQEQSRAQARAEAEERLMRFAARSEVRAKSDPVLRVDLSGADPAEVIIARSEAYGLVLMGAHGPSTPGGEARFGSVTQAVLRGAKSPVIAIRPGPMRAQRAR
jgi:nucleotide-binding universal stress UspA family protein